MIFVINIEYQIQLSQYDKYFEKIKARGICIIHCENKVKTNAVFIFPHARKIPITTISIQIAPNQKLIIFKYSDAKDIISIELGTNILTKYVHKK